MKFMYFFLVLAFCILVAVFAGQNAVVVSVSFFSWSSTGSLSLYLILFLIVGLFLGILFMMPCVVAGSVKRFFAKRNLSRRQRVKNEKPTAKNVSTKSSDADKD